MRQIKFHITEYTSVQGAEIQTDIERVGRFPFQVGIGKRLDPLHLFCAGSVTEQISAVDRSIVYVDRTDACTHLSKCLVATDRTVTVLSVRQTQLQVFHPVDIVFEEIFFTDTPGQCGGREYPELMILTESGESVTTNGPCQDILVVVGINGTQHGIQTRFFPRTGRRCLQIGLSCVELVKT